MRINRGIATRICDVVAPYNEEATMYRWDGPHREAPKKIPEIIKAKEMGQPMVKRKKTEPNSSNVISSMLIRSPVVPYLSAF